MSPTLEADPVTMASAVHNSILDEANSTDEAPLLVEVAAPAVQPTWLHNGDGCSTPPMSETELPFAASSRLRLLLKRDGKMIVCPGVYDGLSARVAMNVGFDALYMVITITYFLTFHTNMISDRCGYNSFSSRAARSSFSPAIRHEVKRRHNRQSSPWCWPTTHCRHGHRIWR